MHFGARGPDGGASMQAAFLAGILAIGGAAGFLAWRWARAIRDVVRGLEALCKGQRTRPVLAAAWGPVGGLIEGYNGAAAAIQVRTDRLERDREQLRVVLGAMAEA